MARTQTYVEPWDGVDLRHGTNGGDGAPLTPDEIAAFRRPMLQCKDNLTKCSRTDSGNAQSFEACFGHAFRYDHSRKRWFYFCGHTFQLDAIKAAQQATFDCVREQMRQAVALPSSYKAQKELFLWLFKSESLHGRKATLELAQSLPNLSLDGSEWNRDPLLLGTPTGVMNLATGQFRDGRLSDLITLRTAATFVQSSTCPRWVQFIREVTQDDRDLALYLQQAVGYALSGSMELQAFFLLTGSGANGKSTFLSALQHTFGDYAYAAPPSVFFGRGSSIGEDIATLRGRRLVVASEPPTHAKLNQSRLKQITGGDTINSRHLYGNPFQFNPVCKIFLAMNELPKISESNFAWWRRVHVIPFDAVFSGAQCDKTLLTTLKQERDGILNWAIEGYGLLKAEGFQLAKPDCVLTATERYEVESDLLMEFAEECLTVDPSAVTESTALWECYQVWATEQGFADKERFTRTAFGRELGKKFEKHRDSTTRRLVYSGVRVRGE